MLPRDIKFTKSNQLQRFCFSGRKNSRLSKKSTNTRCESNQSLTMQQVSLKGGSPTHRKESQRHQEEVWVCQIHRGARGRPYIRNRSIAFPVLIHKTENIRWLLYTNTADWLPVSECKSFLWLTLELLCSWAAILDLSSQSPLQTWERVWCRQGPRLTSNIKWVGEPD